MLPQVDPISGLLRFDASRLPLAIQSQFAHIGIRLDANETAVFARQLEYIYTQTYDILYPEYKGRALVPSDTRVGPAARTWTYRQFDRKGQFDFVDDYSHDFPSVEINGAEFTGSMWSLGASYQYTVQDLREAQMANLALDARKAQAVREAYEATLDSLACVGDSDHNLTGLANAPNANSITLTTKTAGGTRWFKADGSPNATVTEMLADVNAMQSKIFTSTKGLFTPDTLVLPTGPYSGAATTARSPTYTEDSVLQYILKQSPWLKSIEFWPRLDTAGASAVPRALMYKKDPRVCRQIIGLDFEQFAPQMRNLAFVVPCHARVGSVEVTYPNAVCWADGIDS